MGNENQQQKRPISKLDLEILVLKVKSYLELKRDRKIAEKNSKEKQLIQMLKSVKRQQQDEYHKACSIVNDQKLITAQDIIIRYCMIIKDRSTEVVQSQGNQSKIGVLMPVIESIIWAAGHLNLDELNEFKNAMSSFFGPEIFRQAEISISIDPQLKQCFENVYPSNPEVNLYFFNLSKSSGISLEDINKAGHEFFDPNSFRGNNGNGTGGGSQQYYYPQIDQLHQQQQIQYQQQQSAPILQYQQPIQQNLQNCQFLPLQNQLQSQQQQHQLFLQHPQQQFQQTNPQNFQQQQQQMNQINNLNFQQQQLQMNQINPLNFQQQQFQQNQNIPQNLQPQQFQQNQSIPQNLQPQQQQIVQNQPNIQQQQNQLPQNFQTSQNQNSIKIDEFEQRMQQLKAQFQQESTPQPQDNVQNQFHQENQNQHYGGISLPNLAPNFQIDQHQQQISNELNRQNQQNKQQDNQLKSLDDIEARMKKLRDNQ